MALTPWLAAGGQLLASRFELHDVRSLLPVESESCHFEFMHKYLMMMDEGGEEPLAAIWTCWPDHCAASFRATYSICCS
ncbi:hypothetical protein LOK49_LG02G00394 [Camellia lanceoleosa]|uniref:Uncharacterized protein n=1 Tax=Camellia lanceoleosa TaxID=1840588 RepID=A0ACC0IQX7_9ERIC|nr:hypothetical protein LOK49_LG02G00394 [Camellia lanceoleosa]